MKNLKLLPILLLLTGLSAYSQTYEWVRQVGGLKKAIVIEATIDTQGNLYFTGEFSGTVDFDPGPGAVNLTSLGFTDIFILKLDPNGNFLWIKQIGGLSFQSGSAIALDVSGNIYTTGYFQNATDFDPGPGTANLTSLSFSRDIFVLKLDNNGNFEWVKHIEGTGTIDEGRDISTDASGNVYTTGYFRGTADFDPGVGVDNLTATGTESAFILKLDSMGNYEWAKQVGTQGTSSNKGASITTDPASNVYIAGTFQGITDFDPGPDSVNVSVNSGTNGFVLKLDSNGNYVWVKHVDASNSSSSVAVEVDATGNVYTTGRFSHAADFDAGPDTANLNSFGRNDIYVLKLDIDGNFERVYQMGGVGSDGAFSLTIDTSDNIYTMGSFAGTADFDPGSGIANLTATAGTNDAFITKLDGDGNFEWTKQISGTGLKSIVSLVLDDTGNMYVAGSFNETADFDPGSDTVNLTSAGRSDFFVLKLKFEPLTTGVIENTFESRLKVYPNPTASELFINLGEHQGRVSVTITDVLGKTVFKKDYMHQGDVPIKFTGEAGLYLIHIASEDGRVAVIRVLKQ